MYLAILSLIGAFALGLILGSFVNALVWRLYERISLWGRSQCPACRVTIEVRHLVPVISWILLDGKCASCERRIDLQYPLVEFLSGVIVMVSFARYAPFDGGLADLALFAFESLFGLTLLTLAVFDLRWKLLPVEFMAGAALLFGLWNAAMAQSFAPLLLGVAFGALFLGMQVVLSRGRWMGAGDPWLGALLGAGLGWPNVGIGMYLTYIVGGVLVMVLLILGVVQRKARIPFAPLLAVGGIGALWFGNVLGLWFGNALGIL